MKRQQRWTPVLQSEQTTRWVSWEMRMSASRSSNRPHGVSDPNNRHPVHSPCKALSNHVTAATVPTSEWCSPWQQALKQSASCACKQKLNSPAHSPPLRPPYTRCLHNIMKYFENYPNALRNKSLICRMVKGWVSVPWDAVKQTFQSSACQSRDYLTSGKSVKRIFIRVTRLDTLLNYINVWAIWTFFIFITSVMFSFICFFDNSENFLRQSVSLQKI